MVKMKTSTIEEGVVKEQKAVETTMKSGSDYIAPAEINDNRAKAIYELSELTDEERYNLVMNRINKIVSTPVAKMIPTLVVYKEGNTPVQGLVNVDCDLMKGAWDFYKVNVKSPNSTEFVSIITKCTGRSPIVYQRVVQLNLL